MRLLHPGGAGGRKGMTLTMHDRPVEDWAVPWRPGADIKDAVWVAFAIAWLCVANRAMFDWFCL